MKMIYVAVSAKRTTGTDLFLQERSRFVWN
jgi:hypothetical protein